MVYLEVEEKEPGGVKGVEMVLTMGGEEGGEIVGSIGVSTGWRTVG